MNRKLQEKLTKQKEELSAMTLHHRSRYDQLVDRIRQLQAQKEEEIRAVEEAQQVSLEEARNLYSTKMLEDAAAF